MSFRRVMASWLLAIAMAIGGLIPHGYMPQINADSGILEMVICTAHGSVTVRIGPDGEPVEDDEPASEDTRPHQACGFSINSVPLSSVIETAPTPIERLAQLGTASHAYQRHSSDRGVSTLSARGPPVQA